MQTRSPYTAFRANFLGRSKLGAALLGLALIMPGFAHAATCAVPVDQASLRVRMLQTELMVAALTCNQRTDYNAFVTRFQPELTLQGKHLQTFFKRKHGAGSAKAINGFVTRIANESSRRGMQKRGEFCRSASAIYAHSKEIKPTELVAYTQTLPFATLHGIAPCPVKVAVRTPAG